MKTRGRSLFFAILLLFGLLHVSFISAQVSHGGMPCPEHLLDGSGLRSTSPDKSLYVTMPSFDVDSLLREDSLASYGTLRFAHKFRVSLDMENSGATTYLEDGTKVWRVGITSSGAFSLNLLFTEFEIPSQARVFLYSPDRSTILGSFTSANRQESGVLPIAPISGDSLVVEYEEPAGADFEGRLRIGEVNHDYVGFRLLPSKLQAQECEVDINCNELGNLPQKRSVCLIIVNGTYYCTGSLVNNTAKDDAPYVLSASHCLFPDGANPPIDAKMAETSVFFFNYEVPYCYSDIKGTMEQTIAGATVVASNSDYDMLLFKLSEPVPVDYRPYYSGWNVSGVMMPPFYMIHHPVGDLKKVAIENDAVTTHSFMSGLFEEKSHWRVYRWDLGISEGGSSGSPLFDSDNRIVGALSGGQSDCNTTGADSFYELLRPWSQPKEDGAYLAQWLDPINSEAVVLDGKESNGTPCVRLSNIRPTDDFLPKTESSKGYAAGHNDKGYLRYAEKFSVEGASVIYGIYFVPFMGSYSEMNPVRVSIYSGDSEPTHLLHEQVLKISNTQYYSSTKKFKDVEVDSWAGKENYLRLDSAVSVNGNFFVVFDLPENTRRKFALKHSDVRSDGSNTAYFYHDGKWHTFQENPLANGGTSLMVDVVCQCMSQVSQPEYTYKRKTSAVVKENGRLYVFFDSNKDNAQVSLYDMLGRFLGSVTCRGDKALMDVPEGVTLLRVVYDDYSETLRVVR
ncbi:MAG: trypsin-like peptidase domain-containing protein [Paludibacteraceae bacterium]|nr:trypsin-like peptidase domain-containing protein [Paludibacteraceae bacterium]